MRETRDRADESLQRVSDMEEWTAITNEVLSQTISNQDKIQVKLKLTHEENICVFGIPEDTEGTNLQEFIEGFSQRLSFRSRTLSLEYNAITALWVPNHRRTSTVTPR